MRCPHELTLKLTSKQVFKKVGLTNSFPQNLPASWGSVLVPKPLSEIKEKIKNFPKLEENNLKLSENMFPMFLTSTRL